MSNIFNEKNGYIQNPLKPEAPFKWDFMDIIPVTAPIFLKSETKFLNHVWTVYAYSKAPTLYDTERVNAEEVKNKSDMFESRFEDIDEFGWCSLERISVDAGTHIYLHGVPGQMSNPRCSSDFSSSGASGNEHTSQSYI